MADTPKKARKTAAERAAEKAAQDRTDLLTSLKRTIVPIAVGAAGASVLAPYIDLEALALLVASLISVAYYAILRLVETKVPVVGFLLGARSKPTYK